MATFTNQATLSYNGVTTASNIVTGEIVGALTITKTALVDEYSSGDTVTYAISLVNSGTADIDGITVTDDLGAYEFNSLTLVPLTYVEGSLKYLLDGVPQPYPEVTAGESLVISGISVPADGNAVLIYSAQINRFAPLDSGSVIENTASAANVSASEQIAASGDPMLDITKAINPASVTAGGEITYTFAISNTGGEAGADSDIVLTDTFDPILQDIEVTLDGSELSEGADYTYDAATGEFKTSSGVITVPAAEFTQDETTGEWTVTPGTVELIIKGTV